ncbi:DUF2974 domain-containing protein [Collinsella tanakaei]|nr:DUF2974 domain-containing protein [Collinsella tanakaei]
MPTLFDYLETEQATFDEKPFGPLDSAVFSQLSMVDFGDVVAPPPTPSSGVLRRLTSVLLPAASPVRLGDAAHVANRDDKVTGLVPEDIRRCLVVGGTSRRFGGLELRYYRSVFDESSHTQFAACTFVWRDAFAYVGFRGTDISFTGWRENLDMAYRPQVAAQNLARAYLEEVAPYLPRRLHIGGHSKGGNLALYAALTCSDATRRRIERVWSHDAPGFKSGVFSEVDYALLEGRVHRTVPQDSIIGMLLDCPVEPHVVSSTAVGIDQHSIFSWEIDGDDFAYRDSLSDMSCALRDISAEWLAHVGEARAARIVDAIWAAVEASGAKDIRDVLASGPQWLHQLIEASRNLDQESSDVIRDALGDLFNVVVRRIGRDAISSLAWMWE